MRPTGWLALAGVLLTAALADAGAAPYRPANDQQVLEKLPRPADPHLRETRRLARQLAEKPASRELAVELARRYLDLGQAAGDPRYIGLAQGVLGPWWEVPDPPPPVRLLRAAILRARHEFRTALADLDALLAAEPSRPQAHLDRATVLLAQGEVVEAERACHRAQRLAPGLIATTCIASAASLSGLATWSYQTLEAALAGSSDASTEAQLWALTVLGEIAARLGEPAAAEAHFRAARALDPRDGYLNAALADLLLDQGRHTEVAARLKGETGNDLLVLRRALALHRLGDAAAARELARLLEARFHAVRLRGDVPHRREEARLALHLRSDPARALALALENWAHQRGPADARILLEAALAAGRPAAARLALEWRRETGIEDVALDRLAHRISQGS